jgi:hypothetical protein
MASPFREKMGQCESLAKKAKLETSKANANQGVRRVLLINNSVLVNRGATARVAR